MDGQRITRGFLSKLTFETLSLLADQLTIDVDISEDPEEAMGYKDDLRLVESFMELCSQK